MKRYGTRVMMILLIVIFVMTIGFTFILYQFGRQIISEQVEEKLISDIKYKSEISNNDIEEAETIYYDLKRYIESSFDYSRKDESEYVNSYIQQLDDYFQTIIDKNQDASSIYFYFNPEMVQTEYDIWYFDHEFTGQMVRQPSVGMDFFDGDREKKPWFYGPVDTKKAGWTDIYSGNIDYILDIEFLSYTGPVIFNDNVIGVAGVDFYINNIKTGMFNYTTDLNAYTVLIDSDFNTLIHPKLQVGENILEVNNGSLQFLEEAINDNSTGIFHYKWFNDEEKLLSYNQLNNGWYIIETLNKEIVYSGLNRFYQFFVLIMLIMFVISILISTYFGKKIVEPINTFNSVVDAIGNGDFNQQLSSKWINRNDELGQLGRAIIRMENLLKNSYGDLSNSNESLEKIVRIRTHELEESNIELEESLDELNKQKRALSKMNKNLEETLHAMEETQNELIEAEKAVALGYMVKNVAQDLNSPIGNIVTINSFVMGELENIHKYMDKDDETFEPIFEANKQIEINLNKVLEILEQFTAISEKETELNKQVFNVYAQMLVLLNSIDYLYDHDKLTIEVHCDEKIEMYGDASKFMQIFRHLIVNSIDHGFNDREFGHIDIHFVKLGTKLLVQYRDDGVGLDTEIISQIFNPFFTTRYHTEYKGLGLTIVKNNVINVFNGVIEVKSIKNNGVNFSIELDIEY